MILDERGKKYILKKDSDFQSDLGIISQEQLANCEIGDELESHLGHAFKIVKPNINDAAGRGNNPTRLHPDYPDQHISRKHGRQRKRYAVFHKRTCSYLITLLAQHAEPGNVCTRTYRRYVSAQRSADEKPKIKEIKTYIYAARR